MKTNAKHAFDWSKLHFSQFSVWYVGKCAGKIMPPSVDDQVAFDGAWETERSFCQKNHGHEQPVQLILKSRNEGLGFEFAQEPEISVDINVSGPFPAFFARRSQEIFSNVPLPVESHVFMALIS
jgi:hypothetical protein